MTLEIDGLNVHLDGIPVLRDVSATVDPQHWLGLVGPNGAGKTTLLRAIVGLVDYDGEIRVNGNAHNRSKRRLTARSVAYVPQRPTLPRGMTVTDYVLLGRVAYQPLLGSSRAIDREMVARVLERLDLTRLATRTLGSISGGEAQRAVLARALAQDAPVLAMDEPTASLDLGYEQRFMELADELRRERQLRVICALHDLNLAAQYADQILLIHKGKAVASGSTEAVLNEQNIWDYFGAHVAVHRDARGISIVPERRR